MLRRRHYSKAKIARKAERGQKANENGWPSGSSAGGLYCCALDEYGWRRWQRKEVTGARISRSIFMFHTA